MRRRRKLNIPLIKGVVMLVVSTLIAAGSAISGIGAQVAGTPAVAFLLGYSAEKSSGTATAFAVVASAASVAGLLLGGTPADPLVAVLLAAGAVLGTLLVARLAAQPRVATLRRWAQGVGIVIGLLVLQEGMRRRIGGPMPIALPFLAHHPNVSAIAAGIAAGALSSLLQLSTGVLLVPALIYLLGLPPARAIGVSLLVVALAAALPAASYASRGLVGGSMARWMAVGGLAGGLLAGLWLAHLDPGSPLPYAAFGLVAMFLSAWQMWRAS